MAKLGFKNVDEQSEASQKVAAKYEYFKVTEEPKQIRFLTLDGENSIAMWMEHFTEFKNTWKRSTSCPDFESGTNEKSCLLCKSRKGRDEDIVRDNCNRKIVMQVIERMDDGDDKLKVFKFTPYLWNTIKAHFDEYGDLGDRDYTISMSKNIDATGKTTTVYDMTPVSRKATKLSDADNEIASKRAALTDIEPKYNEADIRSIMSKTKQDGGAVTVSKSSVDDTLAKYLTNKPQPQSEEVKPSVAPIEDDDSDAEFFQSLRNRAR